MYHEHPDQGLLGFDRHSIPQVTECGNAATLLNRMSRSGMTKTGVATTALVEATAASDDEVEKKGATLEADSRSLERAHMWVRESGRTLRRTSANALVRLVRNPVRQLSTEAMSTEARATELHPIH